MKRILIVALWVFACSLHVFPRPVYMSKHKFPQSNGPRMPSAVKLTADYEHGTVTVTVSSYTGPVEVSVYDETESLVESTSTTLSSSGQIILSGMNLTDGQYILEVDLGDVVYYGTFEA